MLETEIRQEFDQKYHVNVDESEEYMGLEGDEHVHKKNKYLFLVDIIWIVLTLCICWFICFLMNLDSLIS